MIDELIGKTIVKIEAKEQDEEVNIYTACGRHYQMYHSQDCCESVYLEDICGDLENILNSPITDAREDTNETLPGIEGMDEYHRWTFYNFITAEGVVTLRWYGCSNGYYSVEVDFKEVK